LITIPLWCYLLWRSHYLKHNNKLGEDWDTVWEDIRSSKIDELYSEQKLTIYAVANILNLPKRTVRRKIELLKKKKLINHSTKQGLLPTNKTEELMKPFAGIELKTLSKFLKNLKKNGTLDAVLNLKDL
jgi:predicted transcriptional regulator